MFVNGVYVFLPAKCLLYSSSAAVWLPPAASVFVDSLFTFIYT